MKDMNLAKKLTSRIYCLVLLTWEPIEYSWFNVQRICSEQCYVACAWVFENRKQQCIECCWIPFELLRSAIHRTKRVCRWVIVRTCKILDFLQGIARMLCSDSIICIEIKWIEHASRSGSCWRGYCWGDKDFPLCEKILQVTQRWHEYDKLSVVRLDFLLRCRDSEIDIILRIGDHIILHLCSVCARSIFDYNIHRQEDDDCAECHRKGQR